MSTGVHTGRTTTTAGWRCPKFGTVPGCFVVAADGPIAGSLIGTRLADQRCEHMPAPVCSSSDLAAAAKKKNTATIIAAGAGVALLMAVLK